MKNPKRNPKAGKCRQKLQAAFVIPAIICIVTEAILKHVLFSQSFEYYGFSDARFFLSHSLYRMKDFEGVLRYAPVLLEVKRYRLMAAYWIFVAYEQLDNLEHAIKVFMEHYVPLASEEIQMEGEKEIKDTFRMLALQLITKIRGKRAVKICIKWQLTLFPY